MFGQRILVLVSASPAQRNIDCDAGDVTATDALADRQKQGLPGVDGIGVAQLISARQNAEYSSELKGLNETTYYREKHAEHGMSAYPQVRSPIVTKIISNSST